MLLFIYFLIISLSATVTVDRIEGDIAVIEIQHNDSVIFADVPDNDFHEGQRLHLLIY